MLVTLVNSRANNRDIGNSSIFQLFAHNIWVSFQPFSVATFQAYR